MESKAGIKLRKNLWRIGVGLAVAAVTLFLALRFGQPEDPIYKGTRLSQYLYAGFAPRFSKRLPTDQVLAEWRKQNDLAKEALQALGPRSIPLLGHWLESTNSKYRLKLAALTRRAGLDWPALQADRRSAALGALLSVQCHAAPLIPTLVSMTRSASVPEQSMAAVLLNGILTCISHAEQMAVADDLQAAMEDYLNRLEQGEKAESNMCVLVAKMYRLRPPPDREATFRRIMRLNDTAGSGMIFEQVESLLDPDGSLRNLAYLEEQEDTRKAGAAIFFWARPIMPERVVPLLTKSLQSTNRALLARSAEALGEYGTNAVSALPALSNLVTHANSRVSNAAKQAIGKITAGN